METSVKWGVFLFFALLLVSKWLLHSRAHPKNLPPGPPALPIIGHLHLLRLPLHRSVAHLARRYGPVLHLRFGSRLVLVVSSPSAVEECFTKNDIIFANRPRLLSTKYIHYDNTALAAAPYGPHWRNLRRLTALHLFSTGSVAAFAGAREEEVREMLRRLLRVGGGAGGGGGFRKVGMRPELRELAFNITARMISGKSYHGEDGEDAREGERLRQVGEGIIKSSNVSTLEDFVPAVCWVSGVKRQIMGLRQRMDTLFQEMIDARREYLAASTCAAKLGEAKAIVDVLLGLQGGREGECYTDELIKGVIQVLMLAGIDTVYGTMEWAMALLLNHPKIMKKVQSEVDAIVGHERLLQCFDLPNLPYLHHVIKETLRLYPPGPLLVPHESSGECTVGGYNVPPGTMLLVNAYAIQRDPKLWAAPEEFRPERFTEADVGGYKMIPFGSGRRRCPGGEHAMSLMALALGSLIQCFEWDRVGEGMVDMTEGEGISVPLAKPLEALCRPRGAMGSVLSQL